MRFQAPFSAFNSCLEMGDSYRSLYWLVGLMSPFDFFGALDTPNLNLWGVTVQTPIVAAPITVTENGSQFYVLRSGARYR